MFLAFLSSRKEIWLNRGGGFSHLQHHFKLLRFLYVRGLSGKYQPFWISRVPVAWPWCTLAANQRRPYCAPAKCHSPAGLVSRQWDAVGWAYVLCDRHIPKSPPFQWRFELWGKPEVAGSQIWAVGGLTHLGDMMLRQKCPHESCRMGRCIVVGKLICSLGHFDCNGLTVDKVVRSSHNISHSQNPTQ